MEQTKYTYRSIAKREIAQPVSYLVNSSIRLLRPRRRLQRETPVKEDAQQQPMSEQERFLAMFGLCRVSPSIPPLGPAEPEKQINSPAEIKKIMLQNIKSPIEPKSEKMEKDEENTLVTKIESTPDLKEDEKSTPKEESRVDVEKTNSHIANNESMFIVQDTPSTNNDSMLGVEKNDRSIREEESDIAPATNNEFNAEGNNTSTTKNESMLDNLGDHGNGPNLKNESMEAAIDADDISSIVKEGTNPVEDKTIVLNIGGKETTLEYHPNMVRFYHSKVRTPEEQARRDRNNEACRKSRARAKAGLTRKYICKRILVKNVVHEI